MAKDRRHARSNMAWTREEVLMLRREWGVISARELLRKFRGRSWAAVRLKAQEIGLKCPTRGLLSARDLAARWGVDRVTARAVVDRMSIKTLTAYPRSMCAPHRVRIKRKYVDPVDADEGFTAWLELETARHAARRLNDNEHALWRQAVAMGLSEHRPLRLLPEQWDEIAQTVRR